MREDGWFVAECPILDIATQGKTEEETKENMEDLINEYFRDPDTPKPKLNLKYKIKKKRDKMTEPKQQNQNIFKPKNILNINLIPRDGSLMSNAGLYNLSLSFSVFNLGEIL